MYLLFLFLVGQYFGVFFIKVDVGGLVVVEFVQLFMDLVNVYFEGDLIEKGVC